MYRCVPKVRQRVNIKAIARQSTTSIIHQDHLDNCVVEDRAEEFFMKIEEMRVSYEHETQIHRFVSYNFL